MADKKISDLTLLTTADATDVVPLVDVSTNTTKKTTVSGLAAAVLANAPDDSVTTRMLNPTKSTDANGWTMHDYGNWKEYSKQFGPYSPGAVAGGSGANLTTTANMPVGVSPSMVTMQETIAGGLNTSQFNTGTSSYDPASTSQTFTFTLAIRNLTGTSLTPTDIYAAVSLRTK